jgi:alpha-L-fucosidase 2
MTILTWQFPLPRTHSGVLVGNGVQGLMVWGDEALHLTLGRAGFWDHRGGNQFASRTTYREVSELLAAQDVAGLHRVFARNQGGDGLFPHQVGGGRLELRFADGLRPRLASLDTQTATLTITLQNGAGDEATLVLQQAIDAELAWLEFGDLAADVRLVPAWHYLGPRLAAMGCSPPELWGDHLGGGFCQTLPADDPLALSWALQNGRLIVATALGPSARDEAVARCAMADLAAAHARARTWWQAYWADMPSLALPDAALQHAWDYGLYKLAGLTTPGGIAASLQGPWLEEYQLPPWSCDYHFNVNIQMIYWPCLLSGRFDHFAPLWAMLKSWLPLLQANGQAFFGAADALLMPHAVDDRCSTVGAFWTGMIDQGCAAWMAQLAWLHYAYSGDEQVLREIAWPLLKGAFGGYWAMFEQQDGQFALPVSVSPEFKGDDPDAWGRNASFQLAAIHMLVDILPQAAALLGEPLDPRWAEVAAALPAYSRVAVPPAPWDGPDAPQRWRIALWEGQDLSESHRHHSHLAAIYPFATLDLDDPEAHNLIIESMRHWVRMGAGNWTGWCLPWAAALCARVGWADAGVAWLHWWKIAFTNEGHGTLHDGAFPGVTTFSAALPNWGIPAEQHREVMQIEAGMGVLTAIGELLVQVRKGTIVVLPQIPKAWQNVSFDGLWVAGGFRIGASVRDGTLQEVRVLATRTGELVLRHGLVGPWRYGEQHGSGPLLRATMGVGEQLVIVRAAEPAPRSAA